MTITIILNDDIKNEEILEIEEAMANASHSLDDRSKSLNDRLDGAISALGKIVHLLDYE